MSSSKHEHQQTEQQRMADGQLVAARTRSSWRDAVTAQSGRRRQETQAHSAELEQAPGMGMMVERASRVADGHGRPPIEYTALRPQVLRPHSPFFPVVVVVLPVVDSVRPGRARPFFLLPRPPSYVCFHPCFLSSPC